MPLNASETLQSDNSSQRSSPHVARDSLEIMNRCTNDSGVPILDGSSPPVNTIIFENKNFKSNPNDFVKNYVKRPDKGKFVKSNEQLKKQVNNFFFFFFS